MTKIICLQAHSDFFLGFSSIYKSQPCCELLTLSESTLLKRNQQNVKVKANMDSAKKSPFFWSMISYILNFIVVRFTVLSRAPSSSFQHNFVYLQYVIKEGLGNAEVVGIPEFSFVSLFALSESTQ